ncbi:MAG: nucleotide sugar dehydrogenase [Candidatus Omnitrophica bacterium]|nr:nucleotide sugar dehydrogenase [Candidatus Omnitrophota bacterium]
MSSPEFNNLKNKICAKKARIAVIGLGYVGLPLAVEFAKKGFIVTGIDTDEGRVNNVARSLPYILDVPINDISAVVRAKKLQPTADFNSLSSSDAIIICVPTPLKRKYEPDISFILSAVKQIAKYLKRGQLIVLESTTYPGTTEEIIQPLLEKDGLVCGKDFFLAFSPERIDPGNENYPLQKIPKIVGGATPEATILVQALYGRILKRVIPVSSPRCAESVKLLENTFRLVNIGLINEMAMMANKMDIDIWEVIEAAKTKPFGFMPFYPGPGVGGHCIPKDPLYLYWKAKHYGFELRFIKLAADFNARMPLYIMQRVKEELKKRGVPFINAKILVIGVTYKKDVKDLRKSPAIDLIELMGKNRCRVSYYDPLIPYLKINHINMKSVKLARNLLAGYDCVVIITDHSGIDYRNLIKRSALIFDARNALKGIRSDKIIRL